MVHKITQLQIHVILSVLLTCLPQDLTLDCGGKLKPQRKRNIIKSITVSKYEHKNFYFLQQIRKTISQLKILSRKSVKLNMACM